MKRTVGWLGFVCPGRRPLGAGCSGWTVVVSVHPAVESNDVSFRPFGNNWLCGVQQLQKSAAAAVCKNTGGAGGDRCSLTSRCWGKGLMSLPRSGV